MPILEDVKEYMQRATGLDRPGKRKATELARDRKHSTMEDAARVAKEAGAAKLVATHFSSRYDGRQIAQIADEAHVPVEAFFADFASPNACYAAAQEQLGAMVVPPHWQPAIEPRANRRKE